MSTRVVNVNEKDVGVIKLEMHIQERESALSPTGNRYRSAARTPQQVRWGGENTRRLAAPERLV